MREADGRKQCKDVPATIDLVSIKAQISITKVNKKWRIPRAATCRRYMLG
jgi:hypothetical protein